MRNKFHSGIALILLLAIVSCTTFSKYSKYSQIGNCLGEKSYICINNDSLNIKYRSFGGFRFAKNNKEYKKLDRTIKPNFKNVLIYGNSKIINTEYYILINERKNNPQFIYKDTIINKISVSIAISKTTNVNNLKFLLEGFNHLEE